MKILATVLSLVITLAVYAQEIEIKVDKFTGQKRVQTGYETLKKGMLDYVAVRLRSVDSTYFLTMKGAGWGVGVIGSDDQLIFLLENELIFKNIQSVELFLERSIVLMINRLFKQSDARLCIT